MADDPDPDGRPVSPLRMFVVLLIFAVAVVFAVWLIDQLRESSRLQDCVMSGRTNCAPIQLPVQR